MRYRSNDYSVPVAYGHREVLIRGYVDEVVISCGAEVIARHRRSYDSEDLICRPAALPALDRAEDRRPRPGRAIGGRDLPEAFITLRRLLEARMEQGSASARTSSVLPSTGDLPARGGRAGAVGRRPAARRNRL